MLARLPRPLLRHRNPLALEIFHKDVLCLAMAQESSWPFLPSENTCIPRPRPVGLVSGPFQGGSQSTPSPFLTPSVPRLLSVFIFFFAITVFADLVREGLLRLFFPLLGAVLTFPPLAVFLQLGSSWSTSLSFPFRILLFHRPVPKTPRNAAGDFFFTPKLC